MEERNLYGELKDLDPVAFEKAIAFSFAVSENMKHTQFSESYLEEQIVRFAIELLYPKQARELFLAMYGQVLK